MLLMSRKSAEIPIRKYYPLNDCLINIVKHELPTDWKAFEKLKVYLSISKGYKAAGIVTYCELILLHRNVEIYQFIQKTWLPWSLSDDLW